MRSPKLAPGRAVIAVAASALALSAGALAGVDLAGAATTAPSGTSGTGDKGHTTGSGTSAAPSGGTSPAAGTASSLTATSDASSTATTSTSTAPSRQTSSTAGTSTGTPADGQTSSTASGGVSTAAGGKATGNGKSGTAGNNGNSGANGNSGNSGNSSGNSGSGSGSGNSGSGGEAGGGSAGGSHGNGNGNGNGDLPPSSPPAVGKTVTVTEGNGTVKVKLPGQHGFTTLTQGSSIPVGAVVDATAGTVALTSAVATSGRTKTGLFNGGSFTVTQTGGPHPLTKLRLVGGDFGAVCGSPTPAIHAAGDGRYNAPRRHHHHVVRQLWGSDSGGSFQTIGYSAAATVQGTRWLTQDRCDGTLVRVFKGAVVVHDRTRNKNVLVRAGHEYLAPAKH